MSALKSLGILASGVVLGAAIVIAYRVAQDKDKPLQEAFAEVPAELERLYTGLKAKGAEAYDRARPAREEAQPQVADGGEESGAAQQ